MADDIFGAGDDRQIDPHRHHRKIERRRPGIVDQRRQPARPGDSDDCGDVLHLERQAPRRFHEDRARVRLHQRLDPRTDQRVVVSGRDAARAQVCLAQPPGRVIGAVDHQQMVAGVEQAQQRARDRRRTRGIEHGPCGARIERGQCLCQRPLRRCAAPPVKPFAVGVRPDPFGKRGRVGIENRRRAPHRRIDHRPGPFASPPALNDRGCGGKRRLGGLAHAAPISFGVAASAPHSLHEPS